MLSIQGRHTRRLLRGITVFDSYSGVRPLFRSHTKTPPNGGALIGGPPGEIRTPDTQVRSLVLYPAELRAERLPQSTGRGFYHGFSMETLAHCAKLDAKLAAAFGSLSQGGMQ